MFCLCERQTAVNSAIDFNFLIGAGLISQLRAALGMTLHTAVHAKWCRFSVAHEFN